MKRTTHGLVALILIAMPLTALAQSQSLDHSAKGGGFKPPPDNWTWQHWEWPGQPPKQPLPAPRIRSVNPADPINVDVFFSLRSPYSYLSLDRLLYLASNYNVNMTIRIIFPLAVRSPGTFTGAWYFLG